MAAERAAAAAVRAQPPLPSGISPASLPAPAPEPPSRGGLSLPGILHFIQHEWARFEAEKGRWEAERAELQAQVAFLQGERKGQENLKSDLVRRIKMLEYALKQERSKYHKLKFGTEAAPGEKKGEGSELVCNGPTEVTPLEGGPLAWKEGRQLLRQYLEEVGYSDTILDMRSRRIRSLLGRAAPPPPPPPPPPAPPPAASLLLRRIEEQIQRNAGKESEERGGPGGPLDPVPFPPGDDSDEEEDGETLPSPTQPQHKKQRGKLPPSPLLAEGEDEEDEEDSEDALGEFHFLGAGDSAAGHEGLQLEGRPGRLRGVLRDLEGLPPQVGSPRAQEGPAGSLGISSDVFIMDSMGGGGVSLGDLADLTVTNDNELACDASGGQRSWSPRLTLRGHYDAVRGLAFHPREAALLTASEDGTLKLWNLHKPLLPKKSAALELEPVYAFRGHRGAVLAVAMGCDSGLCCSAGLDAAIRCWALPGLHTDPYGAYDPGVLSGVLDGHGDAVWSLAFNSRGDRLVSCSADGTLRIWDPRSRDGSCLSTYDTQRAHGVPTSVTFSHVQPSHAAAAFRTGAALLYDVETAQPVLEMDTGAQGGASSQVNQVVCHPSQPLTITAGDDRTIRFLDDRTGKVVHSMVAHLDAVTCLAVDPSGVFLMSGSHDCSLRLWHLGDRSCVQELPAHRRKHQEAVHAVAFHPTRALGASAGADALAKVFV